MLGGPETITGYFGGVGQPNRHALKWLDEFLYYYTNYGVRQVLNINPGTVLLGYLLYRLGVDIEFKISVFMGNDNPYAGLWTLIGAKLFARDDGSSPLIGFNWSNSINNETMEITAEFRKELGFEDVVRLADGAEVAVRGVIRSSAAMAAFDRPSAAPSTIRARCARAWAVLGRPAQRIRTSRSCSVTSSCVSGRPLAMASSLSETTIRDASIMSRTSDSGH